MKYLFFTLSLVFVASIMAMPSKVSLSSDEDYINMHQSPDHYPVILLAPVTSDHQRHNFDALRAYANVINMDSHMLRNLMLSKMGMSPEYHTSDTSKSKKNFDEIDKASASFSTLNQLI